MLTYNGVSGGTNLDGTPIASNSNSSDNRSVLDSILGNSGQALTGTAAIIAALKGNNYTGPGAAGYINGPTPVASSSMNMTWIIIGVLVLLMLVFFMMSGKK